MPERNKDPEFIASTLERMAQEQYEWASKPHNKYAHDLTEARALAKAWRTAARYLRNGIIEPVKPQVRVE